MKTCVCDICGQSLPVGNPLETTILGIALDLCPECSTWAKELAREKLIEIMLIGFRECRKNNGVRARGILFCGGPSPVTAPREGVGGSARPPEAGTGGEPSCE